MKSFLLCCCLCSVAALAFGQKKYHEASRWYDPGKLTLDRAVGLKIYASDVLDEDEPVLNVAAEYFFQDRFGVELSVGRGILNKYTLYDSKGYVDNSDVRQDYRIVLEPHLNFFNRYASRAFIGLTLLYRKKKMDLKDDTYGSDFSGQSYRFESASLNQGFLGVTAALGRRT